MYSERATQCGLSSLDQAAATKREYAEKERSIAKAPTQSQSEIVTQLSDQDDRIRHTSNLIEMLRVKLYPVLQEQPNEGGANAGSLDSYLSPFGETLRNHNYRLRACTAELEKLLDQLSV